MFVRLFLNISSVSEKSTVCMHLRDGGGRGGRYGGASVCFYLTHHFAIRR